MILESARADHVSTVIEANGSSLPAQSPRRGVYQLVRLLLVGVFFWSGLSKALAPQDFAATIAAYGLLPENLVAGAAVLLIALELIAAGGLLLEKRGALLLLTLQLLLFMAVLGYGISLGT